MKPLRDYLLESRLVHKRLVVLLIFIACLFLILMARIVYLQVFQYSHFYDLAQSNRVDQFSLPPVRGVIFDRNGKVLATNRQVFNLEVVPNKIDDMKQFLHEVSQLIELSNEQVEHFLDLVERRPNFERQTLKAKLNENEVAKIAVNLHRFSGVQLNTRLQREYPYGEYTAHFLGYVGRISSEDLERVDRKTYRGVEYIGKLGIEDYYEAELLGKPGIEKIETNAHGKVVRSLEQQPPQTGSTLHLGIDIDLQRIAYQALQGYEGAIVAIEPASGDILAFASAPSYDPNAFVNGISSKDYALLRDSKRKPLLNRALFGRYAPGSTIKQNMSLIGMQHGISHEHRVFCPGYYSLPGKSHRYRDWLRGGHGWMDGNSSIVQSCDVFYYQMAVELGIDKIHEGMVQFGYGRQTGIDLANEPSALMPSREWKKRVRKTHWFPGETVITGIGQGYMLVTPLQLAAITASLANYGKRIAPHLLKSIENPQTQIKQHIPISVLNELDENTLAEYQQVIDSMIDVVHSAKGTARRISQGVPYKIAGKTGTAQVKSLAQDEEYDEETTVKKYRDHSLFVGFAPADDPKIAVAVIVEHGGSGGRTAAPMARKVMDYYLIDALGLYPKQENDDVN